MDYSSMHQSVVGVSSCSSQDYQNQKKPSPAIRPAPPEQSLRCPRCDSTNTKFCYYNNYSLSQPRYFCKSCRRYWTKGGILRNIPIGGAYRKHKRSSSTTKSLRTTPEPPMMMTHEGKAFPAASFGGYSNNINNEQIELGLAFALLNKQPLGFHSEFGSSQSPMGIEGVFGIPQMENAGYAFGNGGSGLEQMSTTSSDPNRVFWGFPWQQMNMGGGGSGHVDQIDSGREVWNSTVNYINTGALL
ncbi:hypothetical protein EUTSA_v10002651mg [Eutrema salsugineum]|uniref:Dof zinc finger protein n=1 Tax=Eutrema salsugineum TaxID=72664 RepID=V4L579_EUTSA|nr:dof zinc finger protein DOF3.2 [Eutrema salsugineum]ESQ37457.1 hypothetical protein EUTSA_v10002651mg [Eutrema salsugineum]